MPCITAVTNGLVLELYGVMQRNKLTWEAMKTWGISLTGSESVADVTAPSLRHAVMKVVNHRKNLLKSQKKKTAGHLPKTIFFHASIQIICQLLYCTHKEREIHCHFIKPAGKEW